MTKVLVRAAATFLTQSGEKATLLLAGGAEPT
jgi:hypothetical protein